MSNQQIAKDGVVVEVPIDIRRCLGFTKLEADEEDGIHLLASLLHTFDNAWSNLH